MTVTAPEIALIGSSATRALHMEFRNLLQIAMRDPSIFRRLDLGQPIINDTEVSA